MLEKLELINGKLDLEFNPYIYTYTGRADNETYSLDFTYELNDEKAVVNIRNNALNQDENYVYIDVFLEEKVTTYTFIIYKENLQNVSKIDNFKASLEVKNQEDVSLIKVQILSITLFFFLIILFSLMFKRRKNVKKFAFH